MAPLVERELRQIARGYMNREGPGQTLQPTALINEAYVRLIGWQAGEWQNRSHFYAVAAKVMRRVLVNQAIRRERQKRGGSDVWVSLDAAAVVATERSADLIAIDEALDRLADFDERKSRLAVLGTSLRTVKS